MGSDLIAFYNISSSAVGASLVTMGKKPTVLFRIKQEIVLQEELDFDRFLSSTAATIKSVTAAMQKSGKGRPHKIFFVLSGPWYTSQTRVAKVHRDHPVKVTPELIHALVDQEVENFVNSQLQFEDKVLGLKLVIVEREAMVVKVSGYPISRPNNAPADDLEVHIFVSGVAEMTLNTLTAPVSNAFHHQNIHYATFSFLAFDVLSGMIKDDDSFMFIDINGEVTDISIVQRGILTKVSSFPVGRNFLSRELAKAGSTTPEEAMSTFRIFREGHLNPVVVEKIQPALEQVKSEWLSYFNKTVEKIAHEYLLPRTAFIISEKDAVSFFSEQIEGKFNIRLLTDRFLIEMQYAQKHT